MILIRASKNFAGVVRRLEGLRARMSEAERQVHGLFESLLSESFGGKHEPSTRNL
jgi:hypothetical protein